MLALCLPRPIRDRLSAEVTFYRQIRATTSQIITDDMWRRTKMTLHVHVECVSSGGSTLSKSSIFDILSGFTRGRFESVSDLIESEGVKRSVVDPTPPTVPNGTGTPMPETCSSNLTPAAKSADVPTVEVLPP